MPVNDTTSNRGYQKPNIANTLADDVGRLRSALDSIDTDMVGKASSTHTHGNITNAGAIGATANLPVITGTSGVLEAGSFGTTANTFCQGNDARLSDTRTPTDGSVSTAKLVDDAVTYAKIQNVSATDRLLGRSTAGAGDVEEITCTAAGRNLLDDADAAAQRTTLGLGTLATQSGTFSGTSSGTNTGDQTITLTGDITGTGTGSFATAIASGVIVNADVNASAAIAGTKISPDFGSQEVVTTGTITGASIIPTSATAPTNGVYLPAANTLGVATNGTERMRIRSDGNIGIGGSGSAAITFYQQKPITGGTTAHGYYLFTTIESDVTANVFGIRSSLTTAAAAFTCASITHFQATSPTKGAGSTISELIGFQASGSLTEATTNYGFLGSIGSATGRWNFYASGGAPNYFAGDVRTNTVVTQRQTPTTSNTSVTVTAASIIDGLRVGTPAAGISYTLPTGTNMDAAFQELQTNQSFEWSVINLAGATHAITVVQNTDHTVSGNMAVAANSSGRFLTRKTAANTFITYRIA